MIELVIEKPWWYLLFCLLAGVVYAFVLYNKDTSIPAEHVYLKRLLSIVRGLIVALLAFLLLTPLLKSIKREVEKPIIVLAQDNSESVAANKDSLQFKEEYVKGMNDLAERLKSKYDVKLVSWGDQVEENGSLNFNDKVTDMTGMLDEVRVRYGDRNLGALIVVSDGLYNRGGNPLYHPFDLQVPFYSVALGDTTVRKDVRIGKINFNKVAYLGNTFPVEVTVESDQYAGTPVTFTVQQDSAVVFSRQMNITNNRFRQQAIVLLDAKRQGIQHYKIKVSRMPGEISTTNNEKDIYVEVKENKEKILILAESPHPDIAAIKQAIEQSQNYEVVSKLASEFEGKTDEYNLVILHQLPGIRYPAQDLVNKLTSSNTPLFFVLGATTLFPAFNKFNSGVSLNNTLGKSNDAEALLNNDFSLFTLSDETRAAISNLPPLQTPFGEYKVTAGATSLLFQKIGSVQTRTPLLLFTEDNNRRMAVLAGEGFWRWRLEDFRMHENFRVTNELIQKTVQYLSNKEQKSKFRVNHKISIPENEQAQFEAEVYNDSYELVNDPEVMVVIRSKEGKSFNYSFSKTDKSYYLNAGYLEPGEYSYKATVKLGDKVMSKEGAFSVFQLQQELNDLTANHSLMNALALKQGGRMFYPNQLDQLADSLLGRSDLKSVSYSNYKLQDLINLPWVFFLLLSLLSLEWFVRKRSGTY